MSCQKRAERSACCAPATRMVKKEAACVNGKKKARMARGARRARRGSVQGARAVRRENPRRGSVERQVVRVYVAA